MFEYLPLRADSGTVGKLTLTSSELGAYQYELHLVATPPSPEPPLHFTTPLGSSQQQQCRVSNYAKGRVEYTCKVSIKCIPSFFLNKGGKKSNILDSSGGETFFFSIARL